MVAHPRVQGLLNSVEQRRNDIDLIETFDEACKRAGLAHKEVASLMGISSAQLSAMLRKQRPLGIERLLKLRDYPDGRKFLRAYWPLVGEEMGLPEFADGMRVGDALRAFIDNVQMRMAHAELSVREHGEKRTA